MAPEILVTDILAVDGRAIGDKALATRRRLLEATAKILQDQGVLDLRVVDITRSIATSPATFYQYFNDVDAAILALAQEATLDEKPLVIHLTPNWNATDGLHRAGVFLDAYLAFWDSHEAVLRMRNLKAEEGDHRFRAVRTQASLLLMDSFQAMIIEGISAARIPQSLDPLTTAAALLSMLEQLSAHQIQMALRGVSRSTLRDTLATLLFNTLTGYR